MADKFLGTVDFEGGWSAQVTQRGLSTEVRLRGSVKVAWKNIQVDKTLTLQPDAVEEMFCLLREARDLATNPSREP